jgi:hypothetical protein
MEDAKLSVGTMGPELCSFACWLVLMAELGVSLVIKLSRCCADMTLSLVAEYRIGDFSVGGANFRSTENHVFVMVFVKPSVETRQITAPSGVYEITRAKRHTPSLRRTRQVLSTGRVPSNASDCSTS